MPAALRWLDTPPAAMLGQARDLLARLGALSSDGRISAHGRDMARLPVHPRLAHMLLKARELDGVPLAAQLAALLSERDLLRGEAGARDADVRTRLELLEDRRAVHSGARPGVDRAGLERLRRTARDLERQLSTRASGAVSRGSTAGPGAAAGVRLSRPHRAPARGGGGRFTLANGRGAVFAAPQPLSRQRVHRRGRRGRSRARRAHPAGGAARARRSDGAVRRNASGESSGGVERARAGGDCAAYVTLDALVLEEGPLAAMRRRRRALAAMLAGVRELGIAALPWDREARDLQARVGFLRGAGTADPPARPAWPRLTDAALAATLDDWLAPWLDGVTRREHLARVPLAEALRGAARHSSSSARSSRQAPTQLTVPSGARIRIDYQGAGAPRWRCACRRCSGSQRPRGSGPSACR